MSKVQVFCAGVEVILYTFCFLPLLLVGWIYNYLSLVWHWNHISCSIALWRAVCHSKFINHLFLLNYYFLVHKLVSCFWTMNLLRSRILNYIMFWLSLHCGLSDLVILVFCRLMHWRIRENRFCREYLRFKNASVVIKLVVISVNLRMEWQHYNHVQPVTI